jgi:hypothetical protein
VQAAKTARRLFHPPPLRDPRRTRLDVRAYRRSTDAVEAVADGAFLLKERGACSEVVLVKGAKDRFAAPLPAARYASAATLRRRLRALPATVGGRQFPAAQIDKGPTNENDRDKKRGNKLPGHVLLPAGQGLKPTLAIDPASGRARGALVGMSNSLFEGLREGDSALFRDATNHQIPTSSA